MTSTRLVYVLTPVDVLIILSVPKIDIFSRNASYALNYLHFHIYIFFIMHQLSENINLHWYGWLSITIYTWIWMINNEPLSTLVWIIKHKLLSGADPGFQARGGRTLKKLRRSEGGAKFFGVFRVKNHDFTPKKSYFFQF